MAPIAVIADDQEYLIALPNTLYDPVLERSLISKHRAFATQGRITATNSVSLATSAGESLTSKATITLRWRHDSGLQSFQETFWIVDDCAGYDAILRKDIESPDDADGNLTAKAFHMRFGNPDKEGKKQKQDRDKVRQERDQEHERDMKHHEMRLKKQMEMTKGMAPQVR
jgi:hypothetical protein